jgi:hypothetical protein
LTYHKGEFLDTGFDVVPGSYSILGVNVRYRRGRILTGITCAACHSTVDMETGKVVAQHQRDVRVSEHPGPAARTP